MYGITDLKKGTVIEYEGQPYRVVEYAQKVMGRGGSIVNVKIKNLVDGRVLDKTFKGNEKIPAAEIQRKTVQFLYADGTEVHVMDTNDYSQFVLPKNIVQDALDFLPEGAEAQLQLFGGQPIGLELPIKVPLKVTQAPEVVRGDTQSTVMKEVTVETGAKVQTPSFIKSGDTIIVDTRDGSYVERQKG
jgi:elongation factor P